MIIMSRRMSSLNLHALQNPPFDVRIVNVLTGEGAVRLVKLKRSQRAPHVQQFRRRQRNHVRNGIHESKRVRSGGSIDVVQRGLFRQRKLSHETRTKPTMKLFFMPDFQNVPVE